jgi:hypothetical protein
MHDPQIAALCADLLTPQALLPSFSDMAHTEGDHWALALALLLSTIGVKALSVRKRRREVAPEPATHYYRVTGEDSATDAARPPS